VPSEVPLPIEFDQLPLVARTEIRDVRLVSIEAQAPDMLAENAAAQFTMDEMAYRVEANTMFVRVTANVRYFAEGAVAGEPTDTESDPTGREVGRISLSLLAELAFEGGAISKTQADEFMAGNLLFMMFPYIRTSVQQVSADLRLPLIVLPYLFRAPSVPRDSLAMPTRVHAERSV